MIPLLARHGSMGIHDPLPKASFIFKNQLAEDVVLIVDAIKGNYVFLLIDLSKQRTSEKKIVKLKSTTTIIWDLFYALLITRRGL